MSEQTLARAIRLLKAGEHQAAEQTVKRYIKENASDANGWWVLANATHDPELRRKSLLRLLQISPDHPKARAMLDSMTASAPASSIPANSQALPAASTRQPPKSSRRSPRKSSRSGLSPLAVVLIITLLAVLAIPVVLLSPLGNIVLDEPGIVEIYTTRDPDNRQQISTFHTTDPVYLWIKLGNMRGQRADLVSRWYYFTGGDWMEFSVHESNDIASWAYHGERAHHPVWGASMGGRAWEPGDYLADIYFNGELVETVEWQVN